MSAFSTKIDALLDPLGRGRDGGVTATVAGIVQERVGELARSRAAWSPRRTASGARAGSRPTIRRTSWMKPMSSMRSASSSTNTSSVAQIDAAPGSMRSSRRPGVATRMSTPRASACSCAPLADAAEDHGGATAAGAGRRSRKLSPICAASSRVGVSTRHAACARPRRRRDVAARRCRIGSANAAVLPVPVWASREVAAGEHVRDRLRLDRRRGSRSPRRRAPSRSGAPRPKREKLDKV